MAVNWSGAVCCMVIVESKSHARDFVLPRILMQPGWQNSGPQHWQTLWERRLGSAASRVEQRDWFHPDKEEWLAALKAYVVAEERPAVILAHSMGCIATAMLLANGGMEKSRIAAAVLVAPADTERPGEEAALSNFAPIPNCALGVPTLVIASSDDPYCPVERARAFVDAWQADLHILANAGHINAESGFGPWPDGWQLVEAWIRQHVDAPAYSTRAGRGVGD
ncbi:MAG: RBBP9/YdeN family alpha/beta hydrolase [Acidobacteriaceae bacterium]